MHGSAEKVTWGESRKDFHRESNLWCSVTQASSEGGSLPKEEEAEKDEEGEEGVRVSLLSMSFAVQSTV